MRLGTRRLDSFHGLVVTLVLGRAQEHERLAELKFEFTARVDRNTTF